jgi:hypothetical protein
MTTEREQPDDPVQPPGAAPEAEAPGAPPPPRRGAVRVGVRFAGRVLGMAAILLAAAIVTTFTVDLGPGLRERAATAGGNYLKREMSIGRLSIRLLTGTFIVENLKIGGLSAGDRPFFVAKRIEVSMPLQALLRREVLIESVELSDWTMVVETWPNGRHSFPRFTRDNPSKGPKRFVTTVKYVHAARGEFVFEDHGTPWGTVARNLDLVVRKSGGYRGTARFSKGTVSIQNYVPMWADMDGEFTIENGLVKFGRMDLVADGSVTKATGTVDLGHWPEQTWHVVSRVQFPRMRELFFAREKWRLAGVGDFAGVFHLFKGGRELKGHFFSDATSVNAYRFEQLEGDLVWLPARFEVTRATARLYGGTSRFGYRLAPLGSKIPTVAWFDASYDEVDLARFTDEVEFRGIRFAGLASGRNVMEWPLGKFSAGVHGKGHVAVTPPAGVAPMSRAAMSSVAAADERLGEAWGPFAPFPLAGNVPIAADFTYAFDPEWVEMAPSRFATERTYVEFQGRTAWGERSAIPFHVSSADWQESDRLLAGIMTAFGSNTGAVAVGGLGEFDGEMTNAFKRPRIEGRFSGQRMQSWDVVWGDGGADIVIEDGYVTVANSRIRRGTSVLEADGRFSLGYPRRDGGEEINARVRITDRPLSDLRHAFLLDDYPVDGRLSGEFHLYGKYETPFGFGRMRIEDGIAYREPFDWAVAALRFEGAGVRLDGIESRKGGGGMTGAAYVGWNGTYSFNVQGRRVPMESIAFAQYPGAPLSGLLDFTASGSGKFDEPRYDVRLNVNDLFLADEGIGELTGRLAIRNTTLAVELEAASPRLAVSGAGRIALTDESDADLTFRFTETSLDPYVRIFQPSLSPFTTAVVSGSLRIAGELSNAEHLLLDATVDSLQLRLFDYQLQNNGPIRLGLQDQVARIAQMRLVGEDTRLDVSGTIGLLDRQVALHATGDANVGILQGFFRDIRSAGQADLVADVKGTIDRPVLSGSASIAGGRVRHFALPHSLDAVNGRITFDAGGARLDGLTARLGGGLVRFGGRLGLSGPGGGEFNLTASGEDMRLRYPEGFRSLVDADLALRGRFDAPILSGALLIKSSVLSRRFEATSNFLELAGRATPVAAASAPSNLPLRFDVRVVAPSTLRIDNNVARIVSSADLTLRGTYDKPLLFGRAEIERGEILFEGKRLLVTRGTIDFSNPTKIEPFFDFEAETRARAPGQTYRITASISGTLARFQWALNSDPPLPTVDVLSLLLGNTAPTDPELAQLRTPQQTQQQLLQARAAQLLVSPLSAGVGRVVEQTFGIDTFQITPSLNDPSQQSSRFNPGARLTIGKRISTRAYLTFSQSLTPQSTSRDQIILLEYDQTDRLSWLVSQNEDRTYALEVRVRHAF